MRFEIHEHVGRNAKRVVIVPSAQDGIFVIDRDAWVGDLHGNRAVGAVGIAGLSEETIEELDASEAGLRSLLVIDNETRSISLAPDFGRLGLIAEIEPAANNRPPKGRSIRSFREFTPL